MHISPKYRLSLFIKSSVYTEVELNDLKALMRFC